MTINDSNNLANTSARVRTLASNNAMANVLGGKGQKTNLFASYADNGNISFVEAQTSLNLNERGPLSQTGQRGDIALSNGNGMFIFKQNINSTDESGIRYKSTHSLRIDKDGYLSTKNDGTGYKLMGYKYDEDGNLPQSTSLLSSLVPINLKGIISRPVASTNISINKLNLTATQTKLEGPGETIKLFKGGINSALKFESIILPENTRVGTLNQGDRFTFTAAPPEIDRTFEYGGIALSKNINTAGFYGATVDGGQFAIGPVAGNRAVTPLLTGDALGISVGGGQIYNITASDIKDDRNFNSLTSLARAISTIPGLQAQVIKGRIAIAADDISRSNDSITFTDINGGNLVSTLGLVNVPAAPIDVTRFSSLETLKSAIEIDQSTNKLDAVAKGNNLDVRALLATSGFRAAGSSLGVHTVARAKVGNNTVRGTASINIESANHGLQVGDYIQLTGASYTLHGGGNALPNGHYMVTGAPNSDFFTVNVMDTDATVPDTQAQIDARPDGGNIVFNAGTTWQKVAGQAYSQLPPPNNVALTIGGATLTITFAAAHGIAAGDLVYVSGIGVGQSGAGNDVTVPDGYYRALAGTGAAALVIDYRSSVGHVAGIPPLNPGNVRVKKMGVLPGGNLDPVINFQQNVMTTTGGNGSTQVKLYLPNNNYNIGDNINLGTLANPAVLDGLTINGGAITYKIIARDADSVTFDADAGAAVNGNETNFSTYAAPALNGPNVGPAFRIDNFTKSFQYFGLDTNKFSFNATYNGEDENLSLANPDANNTHRKNNKIFDTSVTVYDSLGVPHDLTFFFARLDDENWAVEIAGVRKNGDFEIDTNREDGVIAAGTITFDVDGRFQSSTLTDITVDWTNDGSATSQLTIDWDEALKGTGITQYGTERSVADNVKANGHSAGSFLNFEIRDNGDVYATLTNNQDPILAYKAAIAMFDNINGMQGVEDGMFIPTGDSGIPKLRVAGENGAPLVNSRVVELSNVDKLSNILALNDAANDFRAAYTVANLDNQLDKEAIGKIGN